MSDMEVNGEAELWNLSSNGCGNCATAELAAACLAALVFYEASDGVHGSQANDDGEVDAE